MKRKQNELREALVEKIAKSMKELGLDPKTDSSEHESIVHARLEGDDETLSVVTHIWSRDAKPFASGSIAREIISPRLGSIMVRPTLAAQAASADLGEPDLSIDRLPIEIKEATPAQLEDEEEGLSGA